VVSLLPTDLQNLSIEQAAQQARELAHGKYAATLEKGDALSAAEHQKVVADLARFTGLTNFQIHRANELAHQPVSLVQGIGAGQAANYRATGFAL
jgi:hypothetical protein